MKHLKILFADDDLKYAMILKRFLEAEGYEVFYAGNGRIALEQYPEVKPDLVLLDINMPEVNGYEVARQIRERDRHVLIFFLTDRSDKKDRLEGFKVRANDYLSKPFYPEELIARIQERFGDVEDTVDKEVYQLGYITFDYTNNELRTQANKVMITSRQAEILRMLIKNKSSVVSRKQLLEQVWGDASYANSLALNVQITYLRKALKGDSSVKIESVMKKGYNSFQSIVSRLQPDVKIHFRGNDISMKLTDHRGRLIKMDGKGRVYVFDTAQKGRVYTDTEGQNMLNITDADGRTMAKNYILGLRDLFRQIDYYRVVVTKE